VTEQIYNISSPAWLTTSLDLCQLLTDLFHQYLLQNWTKFWHANKMQMRFKLWILLPMILVRTQIRNMLSGENGKLHSVE